MVFNCFTFDNYGSKVNLLNLEKYTFYLAPWQKHGLTFGGLCLTQKGVATQLILKANEVRHIRINLLQKATIDFCPKICQVDRFIEVSGKNYVLVEREV